MKTFKSFFKEAIEEETLAFVYSDGGKDQTVVISGSSSQIKRVENKLPFGTKYVDDWDEDAMEISASDWLKIK